MATDDPDDAYVLPDIEAVKTEAEEILGNWQNVAEYTLELPARCPHCRDPIHTIRVVRMTRSKVQFTSTLPRNGRAFVCPLCERLLSIELSGIL
jgi:hypothetical protein